MKSINFRLVWKIVAETFLAVILVVVFAGSLFGAYFLGLIQGYNLGQANAEMQFINWLREVPPIKTYLPLLGPTPTPTSLPTSSVNPLSVTWGGPELWEAVNNKRKELGVNPLGKRDELCTIASIRLNELLELGKLDAHEGFSNLAERREDLSWIFEKYGNISEFLALGGQTPEETVSLWEGTLGHSKLLSGGEYVWGCIYAQNTFAVAIAAY